MAAGTENRIDTSNREIVITRTFDAPRALVCEAFLDAEHIGEWWGPTGFRITTRQFDARPGGRWTFVMHGPDGRDYDNTIEFRRLEPPALLVFAHINPDGSDVFETTVTFVETGGRTELTFRAVLPSKEMLDAVIRDHRADQGAQQHLARLAAYVERLRSDATGEHDVVNQRTIAKPISRVFEAFRDPAQIALWWGPTGFRNTIHEYNFESGGVWHYDMHGPDGVDYHNTSTFLDIVNEARIVLEHHKPMHRFRLTMTFDERDGKTLLAWRQTFDSAKEVNPIRSFLFNANEQNFDRLEHFLETGESPD